MTGDVERMVMPEFSGDGAEASLRPQTLDDFIGQQTVRENLAVFITAARRRGEAMDHVLFHGPPGLGKTTLAQIVARELGVGFRATSGPVLAKAGDLAAILTNLQPQRPFFAAIPRPQVRGWDWPSFGRLLRTMGARYGWMKPSRRGPGFVFTYPSPHRCPHRKPIKRKYMKNNIIYKKISTPRKPI